MFLLVDVHIMKIVTLSRSENGIFKAKLPNVLTNVSQVGLVEFAYDSRNIALSDYTQDERSAYFEYDAEFDDVTTYGNSFFFFFF